MIEQIVSFETAKLAKEKGFNEQCGEGYSPKKTISNIHFVFWQFCIKNSEITKRNIKSKQIRKKLYPKEIFVPDFIFTAPTQSLLQKWLREKHNIHLSIQRINHNHGWEYNGTGVFVSYEKTLEAGLIEMLKLIKEG